MRKNWKYVGIFVLVVIVLANIFGLFFPSGSTNDYARITGLDYQARVVDEPNSQGKVVITERLTFDIHAASQSNLFWELWRELPEEYVDGVKVDYNVLSVKQILADGTEQVYEESPKLYWWDDDYINTAGGLGPGKWFHSKGPYDDNRNFESLLFYVDGLYRETVTFEIQYEMFNAALRYGDASELYLALYYGETIEHLKSLKGQILIPSEKMPKVGNYDAYTYGTNAHEFAFTESDTRNPGYHTFAFELNASQLKFKPYNQYVEFALIAHGDDKHSFTEYASKNNYYDAEMLPKINKAQADFERLPKDAYRNKLLTLIIAIGLGFGALLAAFLINFGVKRTYKFFKPSQELDYFREIPSNLDANFARKLVFCKHRVDDDAGDGYSAAMLSLSYKGYIDVIQMDMSKNITPNNVKIVVKPSVVNELGQDQRAPLSAVERSYYDLITRHVPMGGSSLKDFQNKVSRDYEYTNTFVRHVNSAINALGVNSGYFQKSNYKQPKHLMQGFAITYIIVGLLVMLIGNLVSFRTRLDLAFGAFFILGGVCILAAVYLLLVSKDYLLLTQFGQDEYAKWRGLYNFLDSQTLMEERNVPELALWEQYLIYATAFGISEKVIKALKVRMPEAALANSPILHNHVFRTRTFYSSSGRSFHTATRSATFTSRSGGHGGFGGGGRGGGGGGGGH